MTDPSATDRPRPVRPGEELDVARLEAWLRKHAPGEWEAPLQVEQFPGGYSNLTYLVRAGATEWVLRRPPVGASIRTAHDMGREYRMLMRLRPVFPFVPRAIAGCEDPAVIGAPFYVMERVKGVVPRTRAALESLAPDEASVRAIAHRLVETLAALHAVDWAAAGLADLGRPEGYVARQVRGWSERYVRARTDDLADVERAAGWLHEQPMADSGAAVVHNDFKFDNLVVDPGKPATILAVLDWEMATLGDPSMDLGTSLGYWVDRDDPRHWQQMVPGGVTLTPGMLSREEVVTAYETATGRTVERPVFLYVFGVFKVAVIAQQIYARYQQGLTRDPRFAGLGRVVAGCGEMACRAIDRGRIGRLGAR
jgi:aminoglycoside phosphotransferase (APT) family kinase protein